MFWSGPNHFGQVQIRFLLTIFYNLDLSKMIWTRPKQIWAVQYDWYSTNTIWMVQNHFGPIEGQGIGQFLPNYTFFFQIHLHPKTAGCFSDQNSNRNFQQFRCNLPFKLQVDSHVLLFPTGTYRILIWILENFNQNSGQKNSWLIQSSFPFHKNWNY